MIQLEPITERNVGFEHMFLVQNSGIFFKVLSQLLCSYVFHQATKKKDIIYLIQQKFQTLSFDGLVEVKQNNLLVFDSMENSVIRINKPTKIHKSAKTLCFLYRLFCESGAAYARVDIHLFVTRLQRSKLNYICMYLPPCPPQNWNKLKRENFNAARNGNSDNNLANAITLI